MGSILGMSSKQILELSLEGENDPSYREKVVQRWYVYDMKILGCGFMHKRNFQSAYWEEKLQAQLSKDFLKRRKRKKALY